MIPLFITLPSISLMMVCATVHACVCMSKYVSKNVGISAILVYVMIKILYFKHFYNLELLMHMQVCTTRSIVHSTMP